MMPDPIFLIAGLDGSFGAVFSLSKAKNRPAITKHKKICTKVCKYPFLQ